MNMTVTGQNPVDCVTTAPLVDATAAVKQIEAAFRKSKIKGIKKLEATIVNENESEWLVNITIYIPAIRFPFSLIFRELMPWSFQVSGHKTHGGEGDLVTVTNSGTMDKGPIYIIWRYFLMDQLAAYESFDHCLTRVSTLE